MYLPVPERQSGGCPCRIQAVTLSLRAGQQVTGTGLNSNVRASVAASIPKRGCNPELFLVW